MNKILVGVVFGLVLGAVDGGTAWFYPEVRPLIAGILVGSSVKGMLVGLLSGWFARKVHSTKWGIVAGASLGLLFAFLVAAIPGRARRALLPGDHAAGLRVRGDHRLPDAAVGHAARGRERAPQGESIREPAACRRALRKVVRTIAGVLLWVSCVAAENPAGVEISLELAEPHAYHQGEVIRAQVRFPRGRSSGENCRRRTCWQFGGLALPRAGTDR